MTSTSRPGKYVEYEFPINEVSRLAHKEARARKPPHTVHKWWRRRPSCLWRTVLLASVIDWADWDALEPWLRDPEGHFLDTQGNPITHEADYHRRVRDTRPSTEWEHKTDGWLDRPPTAWQRLFYRLDEEANQVIRKSFQGKWVLDPFVGGGTTIAEGLRLGANVIGLDPNPVAWFTVKKETDEIDLDALERAFHQVETSVAPEIRSFYHTHCPACGQTGDAIHVFWVRVAGCLADPCQTEVPLFSSFILNRRSGRRDVAGMRLADGPAEETCTLVCPACHQVYVSYETVAAGGSTCPACGTSTRPHLLSAGYATGETFTCPACDTHHRIVDAIRAQGRLPYRMVAIEMTCPTCSFRGYKAPDADDMALFQQAQERLQSQGDQIQLPDQPIPVELERCIRHKVSDHGFRHWTDMFNERQLLLLARLRDAILDVANDDARETLLLAWSATLEYYNMVASHQAGSRRTHGAFGPRAFVPWPVSIEGSLWGGHGSAHAFQDQYNLIRRTLAWSQHPHDFLLRAGARAITVPVDDGFFPHRSVRSLLRRSPEDLSAAELDTQAIDLTIVDPPARGDQRVSCLSDFLYVWLRTALAPDYPVIFGRPLTPKEEEASPTERLGRVLAQCQRHLADDGLMVLPLHQRADQSWAPPLRPLLDANLHIKAIYPLHRPETPSGRIHDRTNLVFDALVVCGRQASQPETVSWQAVTERVTECARHSIQQQRNRSNQPQLPAAHLFVLVLGHCLQEYSRYTDHGHSRVLWQGQPVSLAQAIDGDEERGIEGIGQIVDRSVAEATAWDWPSGLDPLSRFYVDNLLGQRAVPYRQLRWRLTRHPHVTLESLGKRRLARRSGDRVRVVPEAKRATFLQKTLEQVESRQTQPDLPGMESASPEEMTTIDRLHLLVALTQEGAAINHLTARWSDDNTLVALARQVADRLHPRHKSQPTYQQVADALDVD